MKNIKNNNDKRGEAEKKRVPRTPGTTLRALVQAKDNTSK